MSAQHSTRELCRRAAITARQANYWRQLGLLRQRERVGSGNPCRWTDRDVAVATVLGRIADRMNVLPAKAVADMLYDTPTLHGWLVLPAGEAPRLRNSTMTLMAELQLHQGAVVVQLPTHVRSDEQLQLAG